VGIANEQSIAWGCAAAFRAFGADIAITYLNAKAKKHVDPLARALESSIVMPLDVRVPGQMEAVFERITKEWGKLDFVVHSIAFAPQQALHGRVVDVPLDGFLTTMQVSCWTFLRMAHLAEPLMRKGGTLFTMTYYGSRTVVKNYNIMGVAKAALESAVRYLSAELGPKGIRVHAISPGPLATRAASGIAEFDKLLEKAKSGQGGWCFLRDHTSGEQPPPSSHHRVSRGQRLRSHCHVITWAQRTFHVSNRQCDKQSADARENPRTGLSVNVRPLDGSNKRAGKWVSAPV
jgi:enoyl-[acyl-carrier-protein] reductase (NADH)